MQIRFDLSTVSFRQRYVMTCKSQVGGNCVLCREGSVEGGWQSHQPKCMKDERALLCSRSSQHKIMFFGFKFTFGMGNVWNNAFGCVHYISHIFVLDSYFFWCLLHAFQAPRGGDTFQQNPSDLSFVTCSSIQVLTRPNVAWLWWSNGSNVARDRSG
jgi:hypothetical protein